MTNAARPRFIAFAFVLGLGAGVPGLTACTGALPLDNRPCPCAPGWTCCPDNTCSNSGICGLDAGSGGQPDGATDGQTGRQPDGPLNPNPNDPDYPPDPAFDIPSGLAGTWTGYFENYKFPSSSDSIKLVISQPAGQPASMSVILGAEPPPPPPTEATMSWPLGAGGDPNAGLGNEFYIIEGFAYTAHEVVWSGQRLRFKIAPNQAYTAWCNLQTSYFVHEQGYYWCTPGTQGSSGGGACGVQDHPDPNDSSNVVYTQVPCSQFYGCHYCACDAVGCTGGKTRIGSFDITFASGSASGSGIGSSSFARPVRLMPAP